MLSMIQSLFASIVPVILIVGLAKDLKESPAAPQWHSVIRRHGNTEALIRRESLVRRESQGPTHEMSCIHAEHTVQTEDGTTMCAILVKEKVQCNSSGDVMVAKDIVNITQCAERILALANPPTDFFRYGRVDGTGPDSGKCWSEYPQAPDYCVASECCPSGWENKTTEDGGWHYDFFRLVPRTTDKNVSDGNGAGFDASTSAEGDPSS
mmetsp:Transcript_3620/g.6612  ORF Transcript_3620/g.6612 Transcript_3620/m.6612 type:complete len:209 (+) Transcript_3620:61-687(+)